MENQIFKRFIGWVKKPFFRKNLDGEKFIKFSAFGKIIGQRPWVVMVGVLLIILIVEVPLRAEAYSSAEYKLIWLAATLTGVFFFLIFKFVDNKQGNYLLQIFSDLDLSGSLNAMIYGFYAFLWTYSLNAWYSSFGSQIYSSFMMNKHLFEGSNLLLAIASAAIVRPLGEEILFRGYFFGIFKERYGLFWGVLLGASLYGIRSLDPFFFIINFGNGILFSLVAHKYKVGSAIIASIFYNLLLIVFIINFGS